ncbi:hypothetical protein B9Q04_00870 [Candidatus Marsarchaeota G2 archaeon BE_D]|jgi:predicted glycosyltransferase|uniref:Glycosyl transferase family 28 C-terminal domain-containing protein n=4 Tax=Candidatus Marsarchaeota group 2 TaxID=2203771 RepID=A0A2R6CEJ8_9ARCH|nr:MAG: hypothetical protein B9Q06_07220 [Candidatus Marsarchaeota G2 archaeon ECH_B_2]PSN99182.1 MAG: hypothetical protein B9Q07_07665 [Candidatus Marsarchaeota G2 archaeon ECH_B_3]PSO01763.1 MAG: hypothetical protein B9Q05_07570 [Candidatus Marsarchaeota G2 archaeon ECH_B_1]PSO09334.1 MAG: hypothetical protein B9Q04_00870 [Candidatus Marsarchaeota G2 archaeon BE_D]
MRLLVGVSSVGLGHVKRSLSIVREIVKLRPDTSVGWLCAQPALSYLESVGENILPESYEMVSLSSAFEEKSVGGSVDSLEAVRVAYNLAKQNYQVIRKIVAEYDLLVQDEFLETLFAHRWEQNPTLPSCRAVITDFVDIALKGFNPVRWVFGAYANRMLRKSLLMNDARVFADSINSVPPSLRGWVQTNFLVTGPIVLVLVDDREVGKLRRRLLEDSGKRRIVCFTIGGTAVGKHILDFAWQNRRELSDALDALLLFLTGPRVDFREYNGDEKSVLAVGFTTQATAYFQASDCVVTQGGASTLNELEALGKPTVCIPIKGHWEQERNAWRFKTRDNYAVLSPTQLDATTLINSIIRVLEVQAPSKPNFKGGAARLAAEKIVGLLGYRRKV